jgi:hypothetical protein
MSTMLSLLLALPSLAAPPEDPAQVARAFFEAVIDRDWERLATICPDPACVEEMKGEGILEVLEIGEPFTTRDYAGVYVPYRIAVREGGRLIRREHNLALRDDDLRHRWTFDGGY